MDTSFLKRTSLFQNLEETEIAALLRSFGAHTKEAAAGEYVFWEGQTCSDIVVVMRGRLYLEMTDAWGRRTLVGAALPGELAAEAYACLPGERMLVSVQAAEDSELLFLRIAALFSDDGLQDVAQKRFLTNLATDLARKNVRLSRRIALTSERTIRGRLLTYFSSESIRQGSHELWLPFTRQELADYLGVDRSALCRELSAMRRDGLVIAQGRMVRLQPAPDGSRTPPGRD